MLTSSLIIDFCRVVFSVFFFFTSANFRRKSEELFLFLHYIRPLIFGSCQFLQIFTPQAHVLHDKYVCMFLCSRIQFIAVFYIKPVFTKINFYIIQLSVADCFCLSFFDTQ